ncbi:MAG: RNA methyltransferase [Phycisphaeraceae bacterium]|nr:RNA methyltransferase [Phycisphaeraceae bacterium]
MGRDFPITSPSNPRIKRLLKLRKSRDRRRDGVFLAEGLREVERAFAAGLQLEELYVCPALLGGQRVAAEAAQRFEVTEAILNKAAYRDDPEGVLAVVRQPEHSLADLPIGDLWLIAVGTEKPGNLGAMVRTAAAAGCAGVLATGPVDVFNPNAIRASTGAVFSLPVVEAEDEAIIAWCRKRDLRLIAATPEGGLPYQQVSYQRAAIVIGPEDKGLDDRWLAAAEQRVTIPMAAGVVDSLNAAATAAVLLFEARNWYGGQKR